MDTYFSDVQDAANELMGNWLKFDSFSWHGQPDDAENCAIIYISNRDADLLTRCNAEVIEEMFGKTRNAWVEMHSHWGPGWVEALVIRVRTNGRITHAFRKWFEQVYEPLSQYPILDEDRFSQMEYNAWIMAIEEHLNSDLFNPDAIFSWIFDHKSWLEYNVDPYLDREEVDEAIAMMMNEQLELDDYLENAEDLLKEFLRLAETWSIEPVGSAKWSLYRDVEKFLEQQED